MQQSEHAHTVGCPYIYFAVSDHRCDELVSRSELIAAPGCLIAVIKLVNKIARIVGVEYCVRAVFCCPENCTACSVRGDARRGPGIGERIAGPRGRRVGKLSIAYSKRPNAVPNSSVVNRAVEVRWHGKAAPDTAPASSW